MRVDQDVADGLVAKQWLQRTKPEDFVDDIAQNRVALAHRQRHARFGDERRHQRADFRLDFAALGGRELLEIQLRQQLAMDATAYLECCARRALSTGSDPGTFAAGSDPKVGLSGGFVVTGVAMV